MRLDLEVGELWLEAKVWSPEGGGTDMSDATGPGTPVLPEPVTVAKGLRQLGIYRERARALSEADERPRAVVLLAPTRLGRDEVPWLPWAKIRGAVLEAVDPLPQCRDLAQFLEVIHVADNKKDSIRSSEAASLGAAAGLYRKASAVMWEVNEREIRTRGLPPWASERTLMNAIPQRLDEGYFQASSGQGLPGNLLWGVVDQDGEAWWRVMLQDRKRGGQLTMDVEAIWTGTTTLSDGGWIWNEGSQDFLIKTTRVVSLASFDEAVDWFRVAFRQLDSAGVLAILSKRPSSQMDKEDPEGQ